MRYEDLRPEIKTGDLLALHSVQWYSRVIEWATGRGDETAWSHMAVFYWMNDGLWLAQEYGGVGFGCYPASRLITKFMGMKAKCFLGRAPAEITVNTTHIYDTIATYRRTPSLRPYGYGSLLEVFLKKKKDPDSVQAVCSIFAQQAWEACGFKFPRLFSPEDFKTVVTGVVGIE